MKLTLTGIEIDSPEIPHLGWFVKDERGVVRGYFRSYEFPLIGEKFIGFLGENFRIFDSLARIQQVLDDINGGG